MKIATKIILCGSVWQAKSRLPTQQQWTHRWLCRRCPASSFPTERDSAPRGRVRQCCPSCSDRWCRTAQRTACATATQTCLHFSSSLILKNVYNKKSGDSDIRNHRPSVFKHISITECIVTSWLLRTPRKVYAAPCVFCHIVFVQPSLSLLHTAASATDWCPLFPPLSSR